MKYSKMTILSGAEAVTLENCTVFSPNAEGLCTIMCESNLVNFKELLGMEIPFLRTCENYQLAVNFQDIEKLEV